MTKNVDPMQTLLRLQDAILTQQQLRYGIGSMEYFGEQPSPPART
jgi:hypothetical protein